MDIDNSLYIEPFIPETSDGDTFLYTEMLDRGKTKNKCRLLKTFYHHSLDEFREQLPSIKTLCDLSNVRACTRLAPRSYERVGKIVATMALDMALNGNWGGMRHIYNRAMGLSTPIHKIWLWDVDELNQRATDLGTLLGSTYNDGADIPVLLAAIPSRKGVHYITMPFSHISISTIFPEVQLHKDNPTNLYIPGGAS